MSFLADAGLVAEALDRYHDQSIGAAGPVINQQPLAQIVQDLQLDSLAREGGLAGPQLEAFVEQYLAVTTRLHHPRYMAHQVAAPHHAGALGSLIDGFTNNAMSIYEMGPGAATIEYFVVNWLLKKVGWQPAPLDIGMRSTETEFAGGVLTNGGSLANLTALLIARNRAAPDAWETGVPPDLVLLASPESHYSITRAAGMLGLGQRAIQHLDVDQMGVVRPERLGETCRRLREDGKRPIAMVANACSTAIGLYDPLAEIAAFCREHGIWLHVDGAHGASALLSERHRRLLRGVEQADSLTWDAHKMLQTPTLCAALLVRDHRDLDAAFQQEASYLFHEKEQPGFDFANRSFECTKAGLGLRFFMVLGALGERALADHVDRTWQLAQDAFELISQQENFACAARPQANIVCFRIKGSDQQQLHIRDTLNKAGTFYLSSTLFAGRRFLRIVLMNGQTSLDDIRQLIEAVRRVAAAMAG